MTQTTNAQLSGNWILSFVNTPGGGLSELDGTSASAGIARKLGLAKEAYVVQAKHQATKSKHLAEIQDVFDKSIGEVLPGSFHMLREEVQASVTQVGEILTHLESDIEKLHELQHRAKIFDNGGKAEIKPALAAAADGKPLDFSKISGVSRLDIKDKAGFLAALPGFIQGLRDQLKAQGEKQFGSAPMAEPAKCPGCAGCQPEVPVFNPASVSEQDNEYLQRAVQRAIAAGEADILPGGYVGLRRVEGLDDGDLIQELIDSEKALEASAKAGPKVSGSAMEDFLNDLFSGNLQFSEAPTLDGMIARRFQAKDNGVETRHPESVLQALELMGVGVQPEPAVKPTVRSANDIGREIAELITGLIGSHFAGIKAQQAT